MASRLTDDEVGAHRRVREHTGLRADSGAAVAGGGRRGGL